MHDISMMFVGCVRCGERGGGWDQTKGNYSDQICIKKSTI
jgi:hypothetical protein